MSEERFWAHYFMEFVVGGACGAFPLVIGFKRGRYILAILAFVACVVGGMSLGRILAFPLAFVLSAGMANLQNRRRRRPRRDPWDNFPSNEG